jgi:chromosome segregation ATPase
MNSCHLMNRHIVIAPTIKFTVFLLLLLGFPSMSLAENDNTKNALAKAQYMLRQVSTDKTNLEKEVVKQKGEVERLTKEIQLLKKDAKSKLEANHNSQQEALTLLTSDRKNVQSKLHAEAEKNAALQANNEKLTQRLEKQIRRFDICYDNNKKLYAVNKEILGKYQDKGFWAALSQKEPFTAIERVKVENLVQDYQYEIENLTVKIVSDEKTY